MWVRVIFCPRKCSPPFASGSNPCKFPIGVAHPLRLGTPPREKSPADAGLDTPPNRLRRTPENRYPTPSRPQGGRICTSRVPLADVGKAGCQLRTQRPPAAHNSPHTAFIRALPLSIAPTQHLHPDAQARPSGDAVSGDALEGRHSHAHSPHPPIHAQVLGAVHHWRILHGPLARVLSIECEFSLPAPALVESRLAPPTRP